MQPKRNSPSQTQLTILETIEVQVAQEKELLSQIRHQVQALTTRRQKLKGEIESETARLLDDRETQLDRLIKEKDKTLKHREGLLIAAEKQLSELRELELQLQDRLKDLHQDTIEKKQLLTNLESDYREVLSTIEREKSRYDAISASIEPLLLEKENLEGRIPILKQECEELESRKINLEVANEQLDSEFVSNDKKYTRKLQLIRTEWQQLQDIVISQNKENEMVRKELASRIRACDEREKLLRVRELKVNQDENTIQRNAELLNL